MAPDITILFNDREPGTRVALDVLRASGLAFTTVAVVRSPSVLIVDGEPVAYGEAAITQGVHVLVNRSRRGALA